MRLGAVLTLPRIFRIFLEFNLIFLELFLFIRNLENLFHVLQILYLHCSCSKLALGIFLEFLEFSEYFSCFKTFSRIAWKCFRIENLIRKKPFLFIWAKPIRGHLLRPATFASQWAATQILLPAQQQPAPVSFSRGHRPAGPTRHLLLFVVPELDTSSNSSPGRLRALCSPGPHPKAAATSAP
jgi:hypothetical protein